MSAPTAPVTATDPDGRRLGVDVTKVALDHARRGVRLQVALRWVLVAFVALTVVFVPPSHDVAACALIVAGYTLWALGVAVWTNRDAETPIRMAWLALFVDLAVLATLTLLTGVRTPDSWTSDVFTVGFLLIPVLAATQLRRRVCAAVSAATVVLYLIAGIATQDANAEPWASLLLRTAIAAGVGLGCVGLSRIQRSRVATIGGLVADRTDLLGQLTDVEEYERRVLSENLHDGALQYVLAARQDLEDARDTGDPRAFDRIEEALRESSRLLRATVAELHPAVLERAGLAAALGDLVRTTASRAGLDAEVSTDGWPAGRTQADPLIFRTAAELLANVATHAKAHTVSLRLAAVDGVATLVVADDGIGIAPGAPARSLRRGHIGLASHRVRIEAAGGTLTTAPAHPGTSVTLKLPL